VRSRIVNLRDIRSRLGGSTTKQIIKSYLVSKAHGVFSKDDVSAFEAMAAKDINGCRNKPISMNTSSVVLKDLSAGVRLSSKK
jgi:hypothetical protein